MKTRLLILAVGVFGVLAFIFASCSARARLLRSQGEPMESYLRRNHLATDHLTP